MKWPLPIASMLHSSSAVVLGYEVYGNDCPKVIDVLHTVFCRISDGRRWVLYRLQSSSQYHIIRTGLKPGYYDEDTRMLHACMALLCSYVEWHGGAEALEKFNAELRDPACDPNAPQEALHGQASRQEEAVRIYRWWKEEKPTDEKRQKEMTEELYGKPCRVPDGERKEFRERLWALDAKIHDDEQAMLHRLVDIRPSLWT